MTEEQARAVLVPIFLPDIIEAYIKQAVEQHGPEYWAQIRDAATLIADVRLFMRTLPPEVPHAS